MKFYGHSGEKQTNNLQQGKNKKTEFKGVNNLGPFLSILLLIFRMSAIIRKTAVKCNQYTLVSFYFFPFFHDLVKICIRRIGWQIYLISAEKISRY